MSREKQIEARHGESSFFIPTTNGGDDIVATVTKEGLDFFNPNLANGQRFHECPWSQLYIIVMAYDVQKKENEKPDPPDGPDEDEYDGSMHENGAPWR